MNRLNPRTWNLNTKFVMTMLLVSIIPVLILFIMLILGVQNFITETRASFITQVGLRQQQGIQSTFRVSLDQFELFLADEENYQVITDVVSILESQGDEEALRNASEIAEQVIRNNLMTEENLYDGIYLVNRLGTITTIATDIHRPAPVQREDVVNMRDLRTRFELLNSIGIDRDLTVSQRDGRTFIEIIKAIINDDGNNIGYIIATLNPEILVFDQFEETDLLSNAYSFLILPTNDGFISAPEVIDADLVSFNSIGVQRVIERDASTPIIYMTGSDDTAQREVLGYSLPVQMLDQRFAIVIEAPSPRIIDYFTLITQGGFGFVLVGILIMVSFIGLALTRNIENPLRQLRESIIQISRNDYSVSVSDHETRQDAIGELASSVEILRLRTQEFTTEINERLDERTRDLRVTQDIGRAITGERDLQRMMDRVVNLIVESFPTIYHAQIFLSDGEQYAVLRSSTGDAGRSLLERGHKLEIGSVSVIGQVFEQSQTIIARDTASSDVHKRNEFLQDTRAELAIPLLSDNEVIGALDVQSRENNAFTPDQVAVLQTLSDDIGLALENIRLFEEATQRMRQVEVERRNRTRLDWDTYLRPDKGTIYQSRAGNISSTKFADLQRAVYQNHQAIVGEETPHGTIPFAVPIRLRNQILGVATYELTRNEFRYDKVLLAEELVSRLAISLDNARLFRESQLSAERERVVNEISAQLQGETNINSILETAIREVSRALRTPHVGIELTINDQQPEHQPNGHAQSPDNNTNDVPDKDLSVSDEDIT